MKAHIFYEQGVEDNFLEASKLACESLGVVSFGLPDVSIKPLSLELPMLSNAQVDSAFINRVSVEDDAIALFILHKDLGAAGLNYCFGRSAYNQRAVIISTSRVSDTTMFGLTLHELGHSMGVVNETAPQYDKVSRFAGHCANSCVMQPVNNLADMNATVDKYLKRTQTSGFCDPCASDLAETS